MDATNKTPNPATQDFVEIKDVRQGVVMLKNGGLRKIVLVSGTNFDLKSEEEQGLILSAFQNFLNGLDFSLQIFIHSRKLNIEQYLQNLGRRLEQETNGLLKNQITEYREFIRTLVAENAIMNKTYFAVIPYDPIQIAETGKKLAGSVLGLFNKKPAIPADDSLTEEKFSEYLEQLNQRVEQVVSGLNQVGLRVVPLEGDELTELFYNLYNPGAIEKTDIETSAIKKTP